MPQSDDVGTTPLLDFEAWRALLRSNCGRDVEVTTPNAFAGWMRPFNACGLEATSVKINWESAAPGYSDHWVARSYRDVRCDSADHYLLIFQVAGQTGAYAGQDNGNGAVRAGAGNSASLARDVQFRTS